VRWLHSPVYSLHESGLQCESKHAVCVWSLHAWDNVAAPSVV
jgi:hypothetical protein